jgi:hypothetical protein
VTPAEILADTRRLLRGTSAWVPDPLIEVKARRKATAALDAADRGQTIYLAGLGVRRERRRYWIGPLGPFSRKAALDELVSIGSFRW